MSTIVTRAGKGASLSWTEADANFTNLNTDKLELSGGTMTGNITFADDSEGVILSKGTELSDDTTTFGISTGATVKNTNFYNTTTLLAGLNYTQTYSTNLSIGTDLAKVRTWSDTLYPVRGLSAGPSGETSLINRGIDTSEFLHGAYLGSDYNYKYTTTTTVIPARIFMTGGNINFNTVAAAGTAGNTITWLNPMSLLATGGANGSVSLVSGQLIFPSTQVPSTNGNTLDDYEENTYTPSIAFGGASTGITYTDRSGRYIKIGKFVMVAGYFLLSSKGSATGVATISLPFAAQDPIAIGVGGGSFAYYSNMAGLNGCDLFPSQSGALSCRLFIPGATGTTEAAETNFTNTSTFTYHLVYEAAA